MTKFKILEATEMLLLLQQDSAAMSLDCKDTEANKAGHLAEQFCDVGFKNVFSVKGEGYLL